MDKIAVVVGPEGGITPEEKDYITNDVVIVSKALNVLMNENLRKMTAGSNALSDFKTIINKFRFKNNVNLEEFYDKYEVNLSSNPEFSYDLDSGVSTSLTHELHSIPETVQIPVP